MEVMKARRIVPAIFIAVAIFGSNAPSAGATTMYWGALAAGDVYGNHGAARWDPQVWDTFERNAGKEANIMHIGLGWGNFTDAAFETIRSRGAIPLVTMGLEGTTLADVAAGNQDGVIRAWAQKARAYRFPFLFRPWWEMNGDWYPWGRDPDFVAAWRHFHDLVVAEGATNVTWAWVVNGLWDDPLSDPTPYYPGDAYVDWVGLDSYNWGESPVQDDSWETPEEVLTPTIELLERIAPGKPICICEVASTEFGGDKSGWIRDLLAEYLPQHPEVKAFLWFNWNVEAPLGRFDWQIESSDLARHAFVRGIQRNPTYRSTLPPLTPLTKVPMPDSAPMVSGQLRDRSGEAGRDAAVGRSRLLLALAHRAPRPRRGEGRNSARKRFASARLRPPAGR
jgi:hypothetical protein